LPKVCNPKSCGDATIHSCSCFDACIDTKDECSEISNVHHRPFRRGRVALARMNPRDAKVGVDRNRWLGRSRQDCSLNDGSSGGSSAVQSREGVSNVTPKDWNRDVSFPQHDPVVPSATRSVLDETLVARSHPTSQLEQLTASCRSLLGSQGLGTAHGDGQRGRRTV